MSAGCRFHLLILFVLIFVSPSAGAQETAARTSVEMKVRGVLAVGAGEDRRSSAIISMGRSDNATYSPGQLIAGNPDLRLIRVQSERIEFLNKGRLEFAPVSHSPSSSTSTSTTTSPTSAPASTATTEPREPREPKRSLQNVVSEVRRKKGSREPGGSVVTPNAEASPEQPQGANTE